MSDEPQTEPAAAVVVTEADMLPNGPFAELSDLDDRMMRALQAYSRSLDIQAACTAAGIAYDTWFTWRWRYPQFAKMVDQVRETVVPEVEDAHYRAAIGGNVDAQKSILKAHSEKYRDQKSAAEKGVITEAELSRIINLMGRAVDMVIPNGEITTPGTEIKERIREAWLDIVTR